jgi:mono/diheme cytochrome c family protein
MLQHTDRSMNRGLVLVVAFLACLLGTLRVRAEEPPPKDNTQQAEKVAEEGNAELGDESQQSDVTQQVDESPKAAKSQQTAEAQLADKPQQKAFFENKIRPLLARHCYECHSARVEEPEAGLLLDTRAGWQRGGESGPAIVPGKPDESLLIQAVRYDGDASEMPPNGKLSDEEIAALTQWVKIGAPDPRSGEAVRGDTREIDFDQAREYSAFRPLQVTSPPEVKDAAWCQGPLDHYIRVRQESVGIDPVPPATPRQLIRRAYFDLLGLPPDPAEVQAFEADPAPEHYAALIDRLLESPHYGERWGRYWLDVARFAESHGFEHDYDRPTAYHYRDFVIQAFNQDLPYDTFVKWQLAGDEFEPQNRQAMMATGFLAAGVHSTQITKNQAEKERYDELDDMLATTGSAMLGLTVGCARCHDHKFDPIPQRDYYRMLSTFTTTVRSEQDLLVNPEQYAQAKAAYEEAHAPYLEALARFEAEQLPVRFSQWEASRDKSIASLGWVVLEPSEAKSAGGAELKPLKDGSLLASGTNPPHDTYTFVTSTTQSDIRAIRIEALADDTLPEKGPGRAANGNFALTNLKLLVQRMGDPAEEPQEIKLKNPRATFQQEGLPVAAVLDDDPASGWAVDPQFGKNHAAAFEIEGPLPEEGPLRLTFMLEFNNNTGHNFGRTRLSITCSPEPLELEGDAIDPAIVGLLALAPESRSPEQTGTLLTWYRQRDPQWRTLQQAADEHAQSAPQPEVAKTLICSEGVPAVRLHTQGPDFYEETYFLARGDTDRKQGVATPGFLQVLVSAEAPESQWHVEPSDQNTTSLRRMALANWITDHEQGAGHLLARVMVNRLWQYHFGQGLVATPNDFGRQSSPPSHPDLLDYLASELIANDWRLKPIHRLIMLSATYRLGSDSTPEGLEMDPADQLYWRHTRRRLDAEAVRDNLLATSGLLDKTMYGPGTLDEASRRRSVYFTIKRSQLVSSMQLFDAPQALSSTGNRPTTTVAPQALLLMNSPQMRDFAAALAKRATASSESSLEESISQAYWLALSRPPSSEELNEAVGFIQQQEATYQAAENSDAATMALADFCQILMCLNEFVYLD